MKLKTFRGSTMAEALKQVKRQYGRSAVILNTRTITKGGLLGVGGKTCVEITAARDMLDLPPSLRRGTIPASMDHTDRGKRAEGAAVPGSLCSQPATTPASDALLSEVGNLKTLMRELVRETRRARAPGLPGELYGIYQKLVQNAVSEEIAQQLVDQVHAELSGEELCDPQVVRARLARMIEAMLPTVGSPAETSVGKCTIIALIGPTGVGKTTTIAKLAANLCLRQGKKVGLITIDTYRIGAVEQLKTYAEIIDVPLEIVMSPVELGSAVAGMADRDTVLIDTAGRSQRDSAKIRELREFFDVVRPDEVHLVLSSTCGSAVLVEAIKQFRAVGIDRVIFTKLDEAIGFGVILECLQKAEARLSYVTTGQDVPDDIHIGEGKALARLILGERGHLSEGGAPAEQG